MKRWSKYMASLPLVPGSSGADGQWKSASRPIPASAGISSAATSVLFCSTRTRE